MKIVAVYDFIDETKKFVEFGLWRGKREFGAATAIGFANAKRGLVAGIVYHNFEPAARTIEMSAYSNSRRWLSRHNLRLIFDYPFNQLNVRLVVARTSGNNLRVRKMWRHFGACEFLIPKIRGPNESEAVTTLTKQQWQQSKFMR